MFSGHDYHYKCHIYKNCVEESVSIYTYIYIYYCTHHFFSGPSAVTMLYANGCLTFRQWEYYTVSTHNTPCGLITITITSLSRNYHIGGPTFTRKWLHNARKYIVNRNSFQTDRSLTTTCTAWKSEVWLWWLALNGTQIAKFMGPTWGPPGSCRPQMGPILVPWTLLLG